MSAAEYPNPYLVSNCKNLSGEPCPNSFCDSCRFLKQGILCWQSGDWVGTKYFFDLYHSSGPRETQLDDNLNDHPVFETNAISAVCNYLFKQGKDPTFRTILGLSRAEIREIKNQQNAGREVFDMLAHITDDDSKWQRMLASERELPPEED